MIRWPKPARAVRHIPGKMNRTEEAYSVYLGFQKLGGEILTFEFEKVTLKLGDDCRYTPDFLVVTKHGIVEFHEIKGTKTTKSGDVEPYFKDDAKVKLAVAAEQFPFVFKSAFQNGRGLWVIREESNYKEIPEAA